MSNNDVIIHEALVGPFSNSVSGDDVYLSFKAQNDKGISLILNKEIEEKLKNIIENNLSESDLTALDKAVREGIPEIRKSLKALYGTVYDFSYEGSAINAPKHRINQGNHQIKFNKVNVHHSHAQDAGIYRESHTHEIDVSINLLSDTDQLSLQDSIVQALSSELSYIKQAINDGQTMEEIGAAFHKRVQAVIGSENLELKSVEMFTPYDGTYDHPSTSINFVTRPSANL